MKLLWFALIVEAIFFWATLSFIGRSTPYNQLLFMLMLLILFFTWMTVLFSLFFKQNKQHRLKAVGVLLLAPASLVLAVWLGFHLSTYLFYRDLPRMKEVIALIENGKIPITERRIALPSKYESLAYMTHASRDLKGVLTVTFYVGGGFPSKHIAYLYRADDTITPEISMEWPSGRRRIKQWFQVSD
jgi:signal transduction histidine kinase